VGKPRTTIRRRVGLSYIGNEVSHGFGVFVVHVPRRFATGPDAPPATLPHRAPRASRKSGKLHTDDV
jgi:hypothetical protein